MGKKKQKMNYSFFKNKKVLVTGHTGFKGSWLVSWLNLLGAKVAGISLDPDHKLNHFDFLPKNTVYKDIRLDLRNEKKLDKVIKIYKPDFVFHLAAQAIVSTSYENPKYTFETNVLGTLNILNSLKSLKKKCTAVLITSDKCYLNQEISRGYNETDKLGGDDFYSASKASAEILINAFYKSYIKNKNSKLRICTARAGNVVGGGDWSKNRLIPDTVKQWSQNKKVILRNPKSTRPWQHVLEALNGYLMLAYTLSKNKKLNGKSFNFSNDKIKNFTVLNFIERMSYLWPRAKWVLKKEKKFKETNLLQLSNLKSKKTLKWKNILSLNETINFTSSWYFDFYNSRKKSILTFQQIHKFMDLIKKK